ncbi:hypothetical protein F2Q70_00035769 [Brassica cretica]|uniref:Uncharacterized protein n=1 Tax=Brassica cretica TaxID=69181 RepID=A0A8S9JW90_BRACR|nr:hypothetical protein F2Q70_00035769 [Brassica cretica]
MGSDKTTCVFRNLLEVRNPARSSPDMSSAYGYLRPQARYRPSGFRKKGSRFLPLLSSPPPGAFCNMQTNQLCLTLVDPNVYYDPDAKVSIDTPSKTNSAGIMKNLEVQIGNALDPIDFHIQDIKLNLNSSLLLGRAFMGTVGAVCNMQTNQLCLTLVDPNVYYDPVRVIKPHTSYMEIGDDPGAKRE